MKFNKRIAIKIAIGIGILLSVSLFYAFDLQKYLTLEMLRLNQERFRSLYFEYPWGSAASYAFIYILSAALSLPGAALLTLAAGAIFGFWRGVLLVSLASTTGATCAFLVSRFIFKETVQSRFKEKIATMNQGIQSDGAFYLFALRLVPIFPFFIVNLLMGLTPMKTLSFFFVSQLGMLPGTGAFVNAGTQLSQITSLKGLLSFKILLAFAILGLLPLVSRIVINNIKSWRSGKFKKPKFFDDSATCKNGSENSGSRG